MCDSAVAAAVHSTRVMMTSLLAVVRKLFVALFLLLFCDCLSPAMGLCGASILSFIFFNGVTPIARCHETLNCFLEMSTLNDILNIK